MVPLSFAGQDFVIVDRAALYWPREKALFVADRVHLAPPGHAAVADAVLAAVEGGGR